MDMWTEELDLLRLKSFRDFLARGRECSDFGAKAMMALADADQLTKAYRFELRQLKRAAANLEPGEALEAELSVEGRFNRAWADRAAFVADWTPRLPVPRQPYRPSLNGLSAVGRLRAQQEYEREASGRNQAEKNARMLNKWFDDWLRERNF